MLLDERFLDCPELPQFGKRLAVCNADLPSSTGPWIKTAVFFACLFTISSAVSFAAAKMQGKPSLQASVVGASVVGSACVWFAVGSMGIDRRKHALFVFENGVHLNEGVHYMIPYGHWWEFCSGVRSVSLPYRVLKGFRVRSQEHKGQVHQQASLKLADGRTMTIDTADGLEADAAIGALQTRLGE